MKHRSVVAIVAVVLLAVAGAVGVFGAAGLGPGGSAPTESPMDTPSDTPTSQVIAHDGDTLTLANDPGQNVSGRTDLAAGTEVVVRLKSTNGASPFIKSATAAVGESGRYEATFDMSGIPAGTEFRAVVRHDDAELGNVSGEVVEGTVTETPPASEAPSVLAYEGDALTVHSAPNQTVSGTTDLAAETEVVVRLRSSGSASPFIKQATTTVGKNGEFSVAFNMSDIKPGVEFTVTVVADGETIDEAPGEVAAS